jgi:hypothetical protein
LDWLVKDNDALLSDGIDAGIRIMIGSDTDNFVEGFYCIGAFSLENPDYYSN